MRVSSERYRQGQRNSAGEQFFQNASIRWEQIFGSSRTLSAQSRQDKRQSPDRASKCRIGRKTQDYPHTPSAISHQASQDAQSSGISESSLSRFGRLKPLKSTKKSRSHVPAGGFDLADDFQNTAAFADSFSPSVPASAKYFKKATPPKKTKAPHDHRKTASQFHVLAIEPSDNNRRHSQAKHTVHKRTSQLSKSAHAFGLGQQRPQQKRQQKRQLGKLGDNFSGGMYSRHAQLARDDSHPEPSEASTKREISEGFWAILADFSLWLLRFLGLDGLLFLLQLVVFSLLLQHYLPPLSRYYFDQSATVLLLPAEDNLDKLLNDDILLTNSIDTDGPDLKQGIGGGEARLATALASFSGAVPADAMPAPSTQELQRILHPAYRTREYTVQSGESISLLAQRYRLNMSTLISANHIERAKSLQTGQTLLIPNMDGLLYQIRNQDNLAAIAQKYDTSIGALIDANQLESEKLAAGTQLFIPGATLNSYELRKVFGNLFIYPYNGRISSPFGYRSDPFRPGRREFHNGIDLVGPRGAKIKASSDAMVVSASYNSLFGNYVILQHSKGIKTLYGHMSKILVHKGQKIMQGQAVGRIGTTGRSTGPHVHFTIFVGGKAVNPLDYLSDY